MSRSSPIDGRERVDADRPAAELVDDGREQRAVHLVEADLVDVEERQRVACDRPVMTAVGAHLGEVADAAQEPVRDARRAARAARDLGGALALERHRRGSRAERRRICSSSRLVVEVEAEVAPKRSRSGEVSSPARVVAPTRVNGWSGSLMRARRRPLPDHEVELEVLHRGVEHLLDDVVQAVDLVDEEHVARLEVGEDRRQVAGALDDRPRGGADADAHLSGDDVRERRLAEARRPVEEHVVEHVAAAPRRGDLTRRFSFTDSWPT